MATTSARMKAHRQTKTEWTSSNRALLEAEVGFETDAEGLKIGESGGSAWNTSLYHNRINFLTGTAANYSFSVTGAKPVRLTFTRDNTARTITLEDDAAHDGQYIEIEVVGTGTGNVTLATASATVDLETASTWEWDGAGLLCLQYDHGNTNYKVACTGIWDSGSNANGEFDKYATDRMICVHMLELIYSSTSNVNEVWTYPVTFAANPKFVSHMITSVGENLTPSFDSLGKTYVNEEAPDDVRLILRRVSGLTSFAVGDTVDTYAQAIGKWR